MNALFESPSSPEQRMQALFGRRRLFAIGGFGVTTAALLAACGGTKSNSNSRVGNAPTTTKLPDAPVDDVVLLRTASSFEHSLIAVYDRLIGHTDLLDKTYQDLAKRFRDDHLAHAKVFEKLTVSLGGSAWTCGNPRLDEVVITPIRRAIEGGPATELLPASPKSDDPKRDVLNFVHAFETLAGETYQSLVPALSDPKLRKEAITVGAHEVRHAALLAIAITGRPGGYMNPGDLQSATMVVPATAAPTTTQDPASVTTLAGEAPPAPPTPIPTVYAVPSQFGALSAIQLVVGLPNDSGTRLTVNLETPSLNSFVYEYMTPKC